MADDAPEVKAVSEGPSHLVWCRRCDRAELSCRCLIDGGPQVVSDAELSNRVAWCPRCDRPMLISSEEEPVCPKCIWLGEGIDDPSECPDCLWPSGEHSVECPTAANS